MEPKAIVPKDIRNALLAAVLFLAIITGIIGWLTAGPIGAMLLALMAMLIGKPLIKFAVGKIVNGMMGLSKPHKGR